MNERIKILPVTRTRRRERLFKRPSPLQGKFARAARVGVKSPIVRLVLPMLLLCGGCGVELEHGLDERQANQVTAALEQAGVAADKVAEEQAGTFKVVVPRGDAARSFALLEARD